MLMNIEIERVRRKMTIQELASKLEVEVSALKMWISGKGAIPTWKLIALIKLFDGCSAGYLLEGSVSAYNYKRRRHHTKRGIKKFGK